MAAEIGSSKSSELFPLNKKIVTLTYGRVYQNDTSAHVFFSPDFTGARETEKDVGLVDISTRTDFLLRIVCLIRGLFW